MKNQTVERALSAVTDEWRTTQVIADSLTLARRTADEQLKELLNAARVEHKIVRLGGPGTAFPRGYYLNLWRLAVPGAPLYESPPGRDIMPLVKAFNFYTYRRYNGVLNG